MNKEDALLIETKDGSRYIGLAEGSGSHVLMLPLEIVDDCLLSFPYSSDDGWVVFGESSVKLIYPPNDELFEAYAKAIKPHTVKNETELGKVINLF